MCTFSTDQLDPPSAQGTARVGAFQLLRSWNTIPGLAPDRKASETYLLEWIATAQEAAAAIGRATRAEEIIGEVLSSAPVGADSL